MYAVLFQHFAEAEAGTHEAAASGEASNDGILGVLGVDVRLLVLQTIAFLVLVWALKKWVYPVFIKAIDDRQKALEAGLNASKAAQEQATEAEKRVADKLAEARAEAEGIIASTNKEATSIISDAEDKAARRAKSIVEEAKADMQNQLQSAREDLKNETRKLVAEATEQIIGEKLDATKDAALVDKALKQAKAKG